MQHEVLVKQDLLDNKGKLREPGWAKSQLFNYSRSMIRANPLRIKEWDYYLILNDKHAVALTIADNSYMGLISASVLNFESGFQQTNSVMTLFPNGKFHLPVTSSVGVTEFQNRQMAMRFEPSEGKRTLECTYKNFYQGKTLKAFFSMDQPFEDTMVIATPWKDDPKAFYYNQKINCMPCEGWYELGDERVEFGKSDTFGTLDWGRGVWTRDNTWYWGSGNGWIDGKRFGFNLGYGFGNTEAASENVLFYDGVVQKLESVVFRMPGGNEYLQPWRITSNNQRLIFDFIPVMDRCAYTNALLISSDQHQVFGRISGYAELDNGKRLAVKDLMCFFEKVHNIY